MGHIKNNKYRILATSALIFDKTSYSLRYKKTREYILTLTNGIIIIFCLVLILILGYIFQFNVNFIILFIFAITILFLSFSAIIPIFLKGEILKINNSGNLVLRGENIFCSKDIYINCTCILSHGDYFSHVDIVNCSRNKPSYNIFFVDELLNKERFELLFSGFGVKLIWNENKN
jgi:hypothetical protein